MIPEEDRPPAWLADYGAIEADIQAMEDFATGLAKEVDSGYGPHLDLVTASMLTPLPGAPNFPELQAFLTHHHEVQSVTYSNTYNFRDGTGQFADAAKTISHEYRGSDAFSRARVNDVDRAFDAAQPSPELENGTVLP
ncbi:hypothetical protein EV385_2012 [Krasilnikovia cinnamomea]|uniref:Uncharacterized protein n=1 Tax=Krasilnikovia cinnamomea TaxID=349313 RepID=A0A4V6MG38_9ACTN|nr:hypothetical protein [Krasilnikovia cinnamomea]RZU50246.1 hypothetical protein EV385_2012 [Krasilnikovia cinnamomea]